MDIYILCAPKRAETFLTVAIFFDSQIAMQSKRVKYRD